MRTEQEMFDLILGFAQADELIRLVGMEGSRTNANVPRDSFQDYDISFLVTEDTPFIADESWLAVFGERVIMQKPEAMELFPPEMDWFSYLVIFEDGAKMDLSIIPVTKLDAYLASDKLLQILLDKDGLVPNTQPPTDEDFWITEPTERMFDDCCNEFWFCSTYMAKGLCRDELLYASWHMEEVMRPQLFTMLEWYVGAGYDVRFSLGKHYKFLKRELDENQWSLLMKTYCMDSPEHAWEALAAAQELFRFASTAVARARVWPYPDYDEKVSAYIERMKTQPLEPPVNSATS